MMLNNRLLILLCAVIAPSVLLSVNVMAALEGRVLFCSDSASVSGCPDAYFLEAIVGGAGEQQVSGNSDEVFVAETETELFDALYAHLGQVRPAFCWSNSSSECLAIARLTYKLLVLSGNYERVVPLQVSLEPGKEQSYHYIYPPRAENIALTCNRSRVIIYSTLSVLAGCIAWSMTGGSVTLGAISSFLGVLAAVLVESFFLTEVQTIKKGAPPKRRKTRRED